MSHKFWQWTSCDIGHIKKTFILMSKGLILLGNVWNVKRREVLKELCFLNTFLSNIIQSIHHVSFISKIDFFLISTRTCLRIVLYSYQTFKTNYSKTSRQKFKVNIYSYRASLALSEYNLTFNFCRRVSEKLVFKVW